MIKGTSQSQEGPNKRQIYKREKLEECREIFYCQCALYLHARNKHNVKLTTKRKVKGTQSIVTYFISTLSPHQPPSTPENRPPSSPIQSSEAVDRSSFTPLQLTDCYLAQGRETLQEADNFVLSKFRRYLEEVKQLQPSWETAEPAFFFNDFLVFYLPQRHPEWERELGRSAPLALSKFNAWLLSNNYSTFELLPAGHFRGSLMQGN